MRGSLLLAMRTAHLSVLRALDDGAVIGGLSSFLDREVLCTWEQFSAAWDDSDTTGRYRAVVASPPPARGTSRNSPEGLPPGEGGRLPSLPSASLQGSTTRRGAPRGAPRKGGG